MPELVIEIEAPDMMVMEKRLDLVRPLLDFEAMNALEKATTATERSVERYTPVDTGRLRASIYSIVTVLEGRVRTNVFYAPMVESGRGPVVARRARALRFPVVSGYIFRRRVGPAEGRHMFRYGLARAMPRIRDAFLDAAKATTRFIAGK